MLSIICLCTHSVHALVRSILEGQVLSEYEVTYLLRKIRNFEELGNNVYNVCELCCFKVKENQTYNDTAEILNEKHLRN